MELQSIYPPHQLTYYRYLNKPALPSTNIFKTHQKNNQKISLPSKPSLSLLKKPTTVSTPSDILRLMDGLDLPVPDDVYISLIKECTENKDPNEAREIFRHVIGRKVDPGLVFFNRVLLMLVSNGLVDSARKVFDEMSVKDSNSWVTMIGGYMGDGNFEGAINLFVKMNYRQVFEKNDAFKIPFSWILVCVLKACAVTERFEFGKQIHGLVVKFGYQDDLFVSSSLMNFYGNFGCLEGLDCVFSHLGNRNTVIWTSKLVSHCKEKGFKETIEVFREMGRQGVRKNEFTFSSVLRACGRVGDDGLCGRQVHANLIKLGLNLDDFVNCGLVDMYAKCGMITYAERVFQAIGGEITLACWNAMLTGYIQHGYCVDAIKVLYGMKSVGLQPQESLINEVRFTCGSRVIEGEMKPCGSNLNVRS